MQNPKKLVAGYGIKLPPRGLLPEKLQRAGVNATCYVAKLADGKISVIILNKDALGDVEVELDFGGVTTGEAHIETLHAPALDSREANITPSTKTETLKQNKCSVSVPVQPDYA